MASAQQASLMPTGIKPVASPVASQSFPPAPNGMNVAQPANEIADTQAVYLQDILLDQPGFARRRGPVVPASAVTAALPRPAVGIATAIDPQGSNRFGVLNGNGSNGFFSTLDNTLSTVVDVATWPFNLGTSPYPIVDAGSGLLSGSFVGASTAYDSNSPSQGLALWQGGIHTGYGTGTVTVSRGSTSVVGTGTSFTGNVNPGMFLVAVTTDPYSYVVIGVVQSVVDATHLTLAGPSPYNVSAGAYVLQATRPIIPKVGTGAITASSTATAVNGGNTKFLKQGLNSGSWDIYRASDMTWIGTVASVQSDLALTLKANAAISVADEAYIALEAVSVGSLGLTASQPGFLTAVYSNRQWYANNGNSFETVYRLWFSDQSDPEILDMSGDGNWIPMNSTGDVQEPIVGIASAYNTLVVAKETETFGVYGNDPSNFDVQKIADDGALSGMSMQNWGNGVIWAGRQGIHFYDGTQDTNITANVFGNVWRQMVTSFDPTQHRMWSMVERDHYILHIEGISPPIAVIKGNTSSTPDHWVVVINMDTMAVTLWQNTKFRGAVTLPATQSRESWYVVNGSPTNAIPTAIEALSPSLYWKFDDDPGSTTVSDSSGNGRTGAPDFGALLGQAPTMDGQTSVFLTNSPLDNDEKGGRVVSTYTPFASLSSRTFMGWANTTDLSNDPVMIGTVNGFYELWINPDSSVEFWTDSSSTHSWAAAWPGVNEWVHWALTYNDSTRTAELFINGISQGAATMANHYNPGGLSDHFVVSPSDGLAGNAQHIAVFESVLSSGQIQSVYNAANQSPVGYIAEASSFFDTTGTDVVREGVGLGPDFYFVSKKMDGGSPTLLKRFTYFILVYLAQGDAVNVDTVLGQNDIGSTATSFPATVPTWTTLSQTVSTWAGLKDQFADWAQIVTSVFKPDRARFLKKSQLMQFRLWQASSAVTKMKIGNFEIGFKSMRPGRI